MSFRLLELLISFYSLNLPSRYVFFEIERRSESVGSGYSGDRIFKMRLDSTVRVPSKRYAYMPSDLVRTRGMLDASARRRRHSSCEPARGEVR